MLQNCKLDKLLCRLQAEQEIRTFFTATLQPIQHVRASILLKRFYYYSDNSSDSFNEIIYSFTFFTTIFKVEMLSHFSTIFFSQKSAILSEIAIFFYCYAISCLIMGIRSRFLKPIIVSNSTIILRKKNFNFTNLCYHTT